MNREVEGGTSNSACVRDNGRPGTDTFTTELEVVLSSVLTVLACSETGLLCNGAAAGDWDLWKGLRVVEVLVVVGLLPAGLSTVSMSREVVREAALPIAVEAAGGLSSFREGSGVSEEK